jgi:hypothetical protein
MPIAQSFLGHKYVSYDGNFYWVVLRCLVFILFLREEPGNSRDRVYLPSSDFDLKKLQYKNKLLYQKKKTLFIGLGFYIIHPGGVEGAHDFLGNSANMNSIHQAKEKPGQKPQYLLLSLKQTNRLSLRFYGNIEPFCCLINCVLLRREHM